MITVDQPSALTSLHASALAQSLVVLESVLIQRLSTCFADSRQAAAQTAIPVFPSAIAALVGFVRTV